MISGRVLRNGVKRATPVFALVAAAMLAAAFPAQAQTGDVSGRVVNAATAEPLEGVRIIVVGRNIQARTRRDGLYTLTNLPIGTHQVRATVIGFATQTASVTVQANLTTTVDFALNQSVINLDAMIVTGTAGEVSRREVGNTLDQIRSEDFEDQAIADVGDILQGRAAGVMVLDNSGQVGTGNAIRLRGVNSITQGNQPLIYVDGVRLTDDAYQGTPETNQAPSPLHDINPDDIERVEVVKGAAATTLYGTEASAGVIQIFTKRGSEGPPRWTVSIDQGINRLGHVGPSADINPTGLGLNKCNFRGNDRFPSGDPLFPADTLGCPASGSWLRTGHVQRYNASVRGGGNDINYFLSAQWGREEGIIDPQGAEDWSVRGNFGFQPGRTFTISFNNSYTRRDITWIPDGNNAEGLLLNVFRGTDDYTTDHDDSQVLEMKLNQSINHFITGMSVNWTPVPGITNRINVGLDFAESEYQEERPWLFFRVPLGNKVDWQRQTRTLTFDYAGTWSTRLAGDFSSSLSVGGQLYDEHFLNLIGEGNDFSGPGDKVLDNAARTEADEDRIETTNGGFFVQEQIGFKDRLFLTAGVRFDGHSAFGQNVSLEPYPKFSLAYTISEENFWPEWWEGMKLRAAYGESGRAPSVFESEKTWEAVAGDDGQPALTPSTLGNPDLGPERSREFEFGFESSLFGGRAAGEFTYWYQRTYDALLNVQVPASSGFFGTQQKNVGTFENKGIEAQLNVNVLRNRSFSWDLGVRYATNKNRVLDLGEDTDIDLSWRLRVRPCTVKDAAGNRLLSAEAIRQLAAKGITADPSDLQYAGQVECPIPGYWHGIVVNDSSPGRFDANGRGGTTAAGTAPVFETRYIGRAFPTRTLGISTSFQVGRWLTVDAIGEGNFGHFLSSGTAYQNARRQVWPECRTIQSAYDADPASINAWEAAKCIRGETTYGMWIEPADFFKLRSLSVAFRLPTRFFPGARSARLTLQARNLFTITSYPGLDPETFEDGSRTDFSEAQIRRYEYYNVPPARSFVATLRFEF